MSFYAKPKEDINLLILIFNITLLTSLVGLYFKGYLRIRNYTAENPVYANQSTTSSSSGPRYLQHLYKTVMILIVTSVITYIPLCLASIVLAVLQFVDKGKLTHGFFEFYITTILLLFSKCITNTMVIFLRNKKAKEWIIGKICCCRKKTRIEVQD